MKNKQSVRSKQDSGLKSTRGISCANTCATFEKCLLVVSAMSIELLTILWSALIAKILADLPLLREVSSLITFHVLQELLLLPFRLSET